MPSRKCFQPSKWIGTTVFGATRSLSLTESAAVIVYLSGPVRGNRTPPRWITAVSTLILSATSSTPL